MHLIFLKGCWVLPLKKVAVLKISNCWWGFLGTFVTSTLLLHLPDDLSRHGGMEIDCVVPQALSCLVTLSTATFEWFAYADLCSVAVLGVVLDTVHILWGRRENVSAQLGWHGLCFQLKTENGSALWARSINRHELLLGVTHGLCSQGTRWDKENNLCGSQNSPTWVILISISQCMSLPKEYHFMGSHMVALCILTSFSYSTDKSYSEVHLQANKELAGRLGSHLFKELRLPPWWVCSVLCHCF